MLPAFGQRIVVAPNVLVSRDGNVAHVESHVAANPNNPRNLLGSAITFTSPAIGAETKAYASFDGGWTWTDTYFPTQRQQGAGDPQVSFGTTGTAYFVALVWSNDSAIKGDSVAFYRSEDGGLTWSKPIHLGFDYDRNAMTVDTSRGRFRGRIYVTSHGTVNGVWGPQLFWSADEGRTFNGPVPTNCKNDVNYLVTLSDGTLWIPCSPGKGNSLSGTYGAVLSEDGGETLTPIPGMPLSARNDRRSQPGEVSGFLYAPVYAVDATAYFKDRIYALWLQGAVPGEQDTKAIHVMFRYSNDRGRTWSAAKSVAPLSQNGATQYLPMAAVNRDGVLGIIWFEALPPGNDTYDVFFTASLDGGDSFLAPRRVTSATSKPDHPENRAITQIGGTRKRNEPMFFSAYSRWKNAGDYTGLTADADGVFHAFWPDARRGAFQLYTSRITVETKSQSAVLPIGKEATVAVDEEVNVEFGPPVVPRPGDDEVIVARLRNVSNKTIFGPLAVTVTISNPDKRHNVTIFDPQSGQWLRQARIDYTPALRDIPFLAPGAATEAIEWRFRNASGGQLNLTTHVYGGHARKR